MVPLMSPIHPPSTHPLPPTCPLQATRRDEAAVQKARDLTEGIMGQFLQFDLRNGSLRKSESSIRGHVC